MWLPHGHPVYLRACVEASLRRLGVERLELCYLHGIDREVPFAAQIGTLRALQGRREARAHRTVKTWPGRLPAGRQRDRGRSRAERPHHQRPLRPRAGGLPGPGHPLRARTAPWTPGRPLGTGTCPSYRAWGAAMGSLRKETGHQESSTGGRPTDCAGSSGQGDGGTDDRACDRPDPSPCLRGRISPRAAAAE
ncbi:aldo/keto reductase [Streptomyces sp. NPDC060035]|uniref:aldo/keto reductase n=1 Tax=Streptomyces sp. NPDC060035 TaxID=3347044 RepID=UPI00369955AC